MRARVSQDAPLRNFPHVELGVLDRDATEITVVRYKAPVLLVSARAENGEPIGRFEPKIKYRPGQVAGGGVVRDGKPAGDVDMVRQADGRSRADQLLPDEEFMLIVEADGYQPRAERLSLPEGAVREMQVRLEKTASRAPPGSAFGAAKTDHPAGDPPAEERAARGISGGDWAPPRGALRCTPATPAPSKGPSTVLPKRPTRSWSPGTPTLMTRSCQTSAGSRKS